MKFEQFWYETSPFMYTALGGYLLGRSDSVLMAISSILLLSAGGTITLLRRRHALQHIQRAAKTTHKRK